MAFDIIQRTCALYVAIKSSSLRSTPAFDRDLDASMVRWKCDDGNLLACVAAPAMGADTVSVLLPWELRL